MKAASIKHLAIIMDGNGRWAEQRNRPRSHGHIRGARIAKNIISACARKKISHLTLYAFSSENWLRPPDEVGFLMLLLKRYMARERNNLYKQNIRVEVIGELERLPSEVRQEIKLCVEKTKNNTGLHLVFALSYGGRQEITGAFKRIAELLTQGEIQPPDINEELIEKHLATYGTPSPDLILRTSGEQRLSNFLLWQSAYSEFSFVDKLWPDFSERDLDQVLLQFAKRTRRFGKVELGEKKTSELAEVTFLTKC